MLVNLSGEVCLSIPSSAPVLCSSLVHMSEIVVGMAEEIVLFFVFLVFVLI